MPAMKRKYPTGVSAVYKKQKTAGQAALVAVQSLKRRIAAATELKAEDVATTNATPVTMTDAGAITNLAQIGQGATVNQRVGQQIMAKRLKLRYSIYTNSSANQLARVLVVQWKKQVSDTSPTTAQLLENTGATQGALSDYAFSSEFKENFRVLHDKTYALSGTSNGAPNVFREASIPLNSRISFNGSATSDIEKNGIWMLSISNQANSEPKIVFCNTLYYTDD